MATDPRGELARVHHSVASREHGGQHQLSFDPVSKKLLKRPDQTWHDHLILLLNLAAAIEHALMVQYLFAAYTLGGEQVPQEHRAMVERWQEIILSVAREEMGHLLTVQNALTLLGAGPNLNRENFPWDIAYYPFPFTLEPLTLASLACYVYAEMPLDEQFDERDEITETARKHAELHDRSALLDLHSVGQIYDEIIELISDAGRIPESAFQEMTYSMQASWDDWGRRYGPDPVLLNAEGSQEALPADVRKIAQKKAPDPNSRAFLLIAQMANRQQAVAALRQLSAQGEGPHGCGSGELSHFQRFLHIYQDFKKKVPIETSMTEQGTAQLWRPARNVVSNPTAQSEPGLSPAPGYIAHGSTRNWAHLFNTRYRILLNTIAHTFRMARLTRPDEPSVRGALMHRVFREMYNLKAIAGILVQLPASDESGCRCAGPPFEMPFSLTLPPAEADVWRMHLDVLGSSQNLCHKLLHDEQTRVGDRAYLDALIQLDSQTREWIQAILGGLTAGQRYPA